MSRVIYEKHIKPKYNERKNNNLCVYCGKVKEDNNIVLCNNCSSIKKESDKMTYHYLKSIGLCVRCHRVNNTGNVLCKECSDRKNMMRRDRRYGKR